MDDRIQYLKFQEMVSSSKRRIVFLDRMIPIEAQQEYFKYVRKTQLTTNEKEYKAYAEANLFRDDIAVSSKKEILSVLVKIVDVEVFRMLEKYSATCEEEMKDWAFLSMQQSKMMMLQNLSGEEFMLVSTGLGGKDEKMRFFVAYFAQKGTELNDFQKTVSEKEIRFFASQNNAEIETLTCEEKYISILILVPVRMDLKVFFESIVNEINIYGNFLDERPYVTNARIGSKEDLEKFMSKL